MRSMRSKLLLIVCDIKDLARQATHADVKKSKKHNYSQLLTKNFEREQIGITLNCWLVGRYDLLLLIWLLDYFHDVTFITTRHHSPFFHRYGQLGSGIYKPQPPHHQHS